MENRKSPITGKEGSPIELKKAASWTKNYRERHPGQAISQFFWKRDTRKNPLSARLPGHQVLLCL